jgi:hydroxyethylthiazole kinase-like sugar kinase family protein
MLTMITGAGCMVGALAAAAAAASDDRYISSAAALLAMGWLGKWRLTRLEKSCRGLSGPGFLTII